MHQLSSSDGFPKREGFHKREGFPKREGFSKREEIPQREEFPKSEGFLKREGFPKREVLLKREGLPKIGFSWNLMSPEVHQRLKGVFVSDNFILGCGLVVEGTLHVRTCDASGPSELGWFSGVAIFFQIFW